MKVLRFYDPATGLFSTRTLRASDDVDIEASSLGGYDVGWVDRGEWLITPATVDAYYNPSANDINFPGRTRMPDDPPWNVDYWQFVTDGSIDSLGARIVRGRSLTIGSRPLAGFGHARRFGVDRRGLSRRRLYQSHARPNARRHQGATQAR